MSSPKRWGCSCCRWSWRGLRLLPGAPPGSAGTGQRPPGAGSGARAAQQRHHRDGSDALDRGAGDPPRRSRIGGTLCRTGRRRAGRRFPAARTLPQPTQVALIAFIGPATGCAASPSTWSRPRWREDPAHVIAVVQSYLRIDDPQQAPGPRCSGAARVADVAIAELVQCDCRPRADARLMRLLASRCKALAGQRETPKFAVVR